MVTYWNFKFINLSYIFVIGEIMVKIIEIISSEPPCPKCKATYKIVEEVVRDLGINVRVEKKSATSREVISKYGIVVTPAIAIDGVLKIVGRVPTKREVLNLLSTSK